MPNFEITYGASKEADCRITFDQKGGNAYVEVGDMIQWKTKSGTDNGSGDGNGNGKPEFSLVFYVGGTEVPASDLFTKPNGDPVDVPAGVEMWKGKLKAQAESFKYDVKIGSDTLDPVVIVGNNNVSMAPVIAILVLLATALVGAAFGYGFARAGRRS